jgi:hypothetical protein
VLFPNDVNFGYTGAVTTQRERNNHVGAKEVAKEKPRSATVAVGERMDEEQAIPLTHTTHPNKGGSPCPK